MYQIDLNCDMGEYDFANPKSTDQKLMKYISSCNIACGAHAGDKAVIQKTVEVASQNQVKIGAHPSYPDKEGFGRRPMRMPAMELEETLTEQISLVYGITSTCGKKLNHVKPHGALYNAAAKSFTISESIVNSIVNIDSSLQLYAPYNSVLEEVGLAADLHVVTEAFADRTYNDDLSLLVRTHPKSILHNPDQVTKQVIKIIRSGLVNTIDQHEVAIKAETICIHGDHPNSLDITKHIYTALEAYGIEVLKA